MNISLLFCPFVIRGPCAAYGTEGLNLEQYVYDCRNDKNQFWQVNNMFMYCRNDKNQFWHPYYISIKWKLGAPKTKLIINKSCGEKLMKLNYIFKTSFLSVLLI